MAQMKEQGKKKKPREKELNEIEISNLSHANFKTQVIRMLKEHMGYFNNINKT